MLSKKIRTKLLNAAELFHYSNKFRGQVFLALFKNSQDFLRLITDIKVLHKAQIKVVAVIEQKEEFSAVVDHCRLDLDFICFPSVGQDIHLQLIQAHKDGLCPVISLSEQSTVQFVGSLSQFFLIHKLIMLGCYEPIKVDGQIKHYITHRDLRERAERNQSYQILSGYFEYLQYNTDLVLLEAEEGALFKEIFTYLGAGTLITAITDIIFRPATLRQVPQIYYILLNYIEDGLILPITEQEIAERISDFFVLSIEDEVIAVISIKIYEQAAELAKLCTLPRYRNQGLAKRLISEVLNYTKALNLDYLFALSRNNDVLDLFRSFGFQDCEREILPRSWQESYDFSRPSRACRMSITSK